MTLRTIVILSVGFAKSAGMIKNCSLRFDRLFCCATTPPLDAWWPITQIRDSGLPLPDRRLGDSASAYQSRLGTKNCTAAISDNGAIDFKRVSLDPVVEKRSVLINFPDGRSEHFE